MPTNDPREALARKAAAEDAFLAFARGDGAGDRDQADALLKVFAAASERFTAAVAPLRLPHAGVQTAWLRDRSYTVVYGWEERRGTPVGQPGYRLLRAHQEARDGLWHWVHPEQADELRALLRALDSEIVRLAAADAREEFGPDAGIAVWLEERAQGAMH